MRYIGGCGPYVYHSVWSNGKVKTEYLGRFGTPHKHSVNRYGAWKPKKTPLNELAVVSIGRKVSAGEDINPEEHGLHRLEHIGHRNIFKHGINKGLWDKHEEKTMLKGRYIDQKSSHYPFAKKFIDTHQGKGIIFWGESDPRDNTPEFFKDKNKYQGFEQQLNLMRKEGVPEDTVIGVGRPKGEFIALGKLKDYKIESPEDE